MTTPESLAVTVEMAKRLRKAGWPQIVGRHETTVFYWNKQDRWWLSEGSACHRQLPGNTDSVAAPTAEELLRRLPAIIPASEKTHRFDAFLGVDIGLRRGPKHSQFWRVTYQGDHGEFFQTFGRPSLADAAAEMFCFLADHELLPAEMARPGENG